MIPQVGEDKSIPLVGGRGEPEGVLDGLGQVRDVPDKKPADALLAEDRLHGVDGEE